MRLPRRAFITTALAFLLAGPALAQEQTQAAVDTYNAAYAEALGVSVADGIAYQAQAAAAATLDAQLAGTPGYAGMRILPGATFSADVRFTGDDGARLLAAATTNPAFRAVRALHAPALVQQTLDRVSGVLRPLNVPHLLFYDDREQRIKIQARVTALIGPALAPLGLAIPFDIVQSNDVVVPTADFEGGREVTYGARGCTSGLSVQHPDGRKGITTAGHCDAAQVRFKGVVVPLAQNFYGVRDVRWHSSATDSFTPHAWVGTGYLRIRQSVARGAGQPICLMGHVSGLRCARIDRLGVNGVDGDGRAFSNATTFRRDDNSYVIEKGDSGGPLVTADDSIGKAHGVAFGGNEPSGTDRFRNGYFVVESDFPTVLGIRVQTSP